MPFSFVQGHEKAAQGAGSGIFPNTTPPIHQKAGTATNNVGCSRFFCLFLIWNMLHQIAGLIFKNGADLV